MSNAPKKAKTVQDVSGRFYGIHIKCPGCSGHVLPVHWLPEGGDESEHAKDKPHWTFNGDFERPTLAPSIRSRWTDENEFEHVCHSFVKEGQIEFLGDCTHALRGQTVDLPPVSDQERAA